MTKFQITVPTITFIFWSVSLWETDRSLYITELLDLPSLPLPEGNSE
jgi:hypothetical protein